MNHARLFLLLSAILSYAPNAVASVTNWSMPDPSNVILLSWINGPPKIQAHRLNDAHFKDYRSEDAVLAFRSGKWGMLFDLQQMSVSHMIVGSSTDPAEELLGYWALRRHWKPSALKLTATIDGTEYRATGYKPTGKTSLSDGPVRIVESGIWFQHVIYDLEMVDESGNTCPGKTELEIRAWGDTCVFQLHRYSEDIDGDSKKRQQKESLQQKLSIELNCDALNILLHREALGDQVKLSVNFEKPISHHAAHHAPVRVSAVSENEKDLGQPTVEFSELTNAWEIHLPKQQWDRSGGAAYPTSELQRRSTFGLTLENPTNQARELRLRFVHPRHPITGYVPLLVHSDHSQTGLPVQNSKNWHIDAENPHRYQGNWIHVSTRLQMKANSKVELKYVIVHALWQGVPASSSAQLSLIGWGSNGFWTQLALGSWGESICIQPGRAQRRSFITDVRPFMTKQPNKGKEYNWSSNVGGADIAKIIDTQEQYVLWRGAIGEQLMVGPNLSRVRLRERTADEKLKMQIDTYLPRSDSINRSYFKVRLQALKKVAFNELVLFQLGSDYYNSVDARKIAWGNRKGLTKELAPPRGQWKRVMAPVRLTGPHAWVSLHGEPSGPDFVPRGMRGLVVRHFDAHIGKDRYRTPWLQSSRTKDFLNAELILPPKIKELNAGDTIEFTIEHDVFAARPTDYYGHDPHLKQRLDATPNSWQLTAFEAKHQRLSIDGKEQTFPAKVNFSAINQDQTFTVASRSSMDTVCITGLPHPKEWKLVELIDGQSIPLGERFSEETDPQLNFDLSSSTWTAVVSLNLSAENSHSASLEATSLSRRTFQIKTSTTLSGKPMESKQ